MRILSPSATDSEILNAIGDWVLVMEREDFQAAYDMTYHPKKRTDMNMDISPDMLHRLAMYYGSPIPLAHLPERFRITSKYSPSESPHWPRRDVHRFQDMSSDSPAWGPTFDESQRECASEGSIGYVWYDLALNGKPSDLTALFDLITLEDGLVLILTQLGVM